MLRIQLNDGLWRQLDDALSIDAGIAHFEIPGHVFAAGNRQEVVDECIAGNRAYPSSSARSG